MQSFKNAQYSKRTFVLLDALQFSKYLCLLCFYYKTFTKIIFKSNGLLLLNCIMLISNLLRRQQEHYSLKDKMGFQIFQGFKYCFKKVIYQQSLIYLFMKRRKKSKAREDRHNSLLQTVNQLSYCDFT